MRPEIRFTPPRRARRRIAYRGIYERTVRCRGLRTHWLSDTLDVVTKNLAVSFGATLPETLLQCESEQRWDDPNQYNTPCHPFHVQTCCMRWVMCFDNLYKRRITLVVSTTMVVKEGKWTSSKRSLVRQLYACGRVCDNHVTGIYQFTSTSYLRLESLDTSESYERSLYREFTTCSHTAPKAGQERRIHASHEEHRTEATLHGEVGTTCVFQTCWATEWATMNNDRCMSRHGASSLDSHIGKWYETKEPPLNILTGSMHPVLCRWCSNLEWIK